jgi:hypothetical protein
MRHPLFSAGVSGDFLVEDEKAILKFGNLGTHARAMLFQQSAALRFSLDAAFPKFCIAQHFPDRHPRRFQAVEKFDPDQDRCVVVTLARLVPIGIGKQPDPLVIADRMRRQTRAFRQLTDLHEHLLLSRRLGS